MTIDELQNLVDYEIQWLYYYANRKSRYSLNEKSSIYGDLSSIGYTKRPMNLESRCCPCIITSNETIVENMDINTLIKTTGKRSNNNYSPVEAYIIIFPEKKMEIINKLKE